METAKDILIKHSCSSGEGITDPRLIAVIKEIADNAWEAGFDRAMHEHDPLYYGEHLDKSTYMKSLFP